MARHHRISLCFVALLAGALCDMAALAAQKYDDAPSTEALLDVRVDGRAVGVAQVRRTATGGVFVNRDDALAWRLSPPEANARQSDGNTYYALRDFASLTYRVDEAAQALWIDVPPAMFDRTVVPGTDRRLIAPSTSSVGAFLNYDASLSRTQGAPSSGSTLLELGGFGPAGNVVTSALVGQQLSGSTRAVRLETTWTTDRPAHVSSFRAGDSISGASAWGESVRFGGLQLATDFSTQPSLITFPLPTLSATAAAASSVDLYVNNVLRLHRDVPAGPFDIQDVPLLNGQGNLQLVVRDLLGREQVISQPFSAGGGLLSPGLRSYSYEAGFQRQDYGVRSNAYGPFMAAGTERLGLTDGLTGELHGEAEPGRYALGTSATWRVSTLGIAQAFVAGSGGTKGSGAALGAGFDHDGRVFSYGFHGEWHTGHFSQAGYDVTPPPWRTAAAYASLSTARQGSLSLNYTREDFASDAPVHLAGVSYNREIGRLGFLTASAVAFLQGGSGMVFNLTFTRILGARDTASAATHTTGSMRGGNVTLRRSLPAESGIGYGLQAGLSPEDSSQADITVQTETGVYTAEAARTGNVDGFRVGAHGSVALLGGRVYASRHIDDSFASVEVPGFPGVHVYADNQPIAVTDADGFALVPRLRAYQDNPLRIEQADLPMDAVIDTMDASVVPARRSAVAVRFAVTRVRSAVVVLVQPDGSVLPSGAWVQVDGHDGRFPVGERGETYLTNLADVNPLRVHVGSRACALTLRLPPGDEPQPRIGPLVCTPERTS